MKRTKIWTLGDGFNDFAEIDSLRNVCIPVPVQSPCVMPVEEVRLRSQGADVRVEPQKLQQSPGASLFNPYDESLG